MAAERSPTPVAPWTVVDLLDFDGLLAADAADGVGESVLRQRDEAIAQAMLREQVVDAQALRPDASVESRRKVLRWWLEARRDQEEGKKTSAAVSPGEAFSGSRWLVAVVLGLLSLLAGMGVVSSILHREQRYFNVVLFLAVTLLPQLLLLVALGVGWLLRGRQHGKAAGFFQAITRRAVEALSEKALARKLKVGDRATGSWRALRRRPYLGWPLAAATQTAAVLFNVGLLLAFAASLMVMDLRFFWESTPTVEAAKSLKGIVDALALPWSWALPDLVPTLEEVEATRIAALNDFTERADSAGVWAPFLFLTLAAWGLLPRLLLRLLVGWMGTRSIRRQAFGERAHRELWRRLTEVRLEAPVVGPQDDAIVLLWGGATPDAAKLRTALLQQARWHPVATLAVGGLDVQADRTAVEATVAKLRAAERPVRIALVADSWALVPRDLAPFLRQLRAAIGEEVAILCFLLGAPKGGDASAFTPPAEAEIAVWENFASDLNDAHLRVQPYRASANADAS